MPFPSSEDLRDPGSNPGLLHCRHILYHLSYQGSLPTPKSWGGEWEGEYNLGTGSGLGLQFSYQLLDQCLAPCLNVCLVAQLCPTHCNPLNCSPPGSTVQGVFLARILGWVAGVGCCFLLQGIFLTQGLNPCLLQFPLCRQILYPLSRSGSLYLIGYDLWGSPYKESLASY